MKPVVIKTKTGSTIEVKLLETADFVEVDVAIKNNKIYFNLEQEQVIELMEALHDAFMELPQPKFEAGFSVVRGDFTFFILDGVRVEHNTHQAYLAAADTVINNVTNEIVKHRKQ